MVRPAAGQEEAADHWEHPTAGSGSLAISGEALPLVALYSLPMGNVGLGQKGWSWVKGHKWGTGLPSKYGEE